MVRVEVQDGPLADVGLKVAVERDGNPVTLKLTLLEKPLIGVIVTGKLTLEPSINCLGRGRRNAEAAHVLAHDIRSA